MHRSFTSERAAADAPPDRKECRPKFGSTDLSFFNIFSLADVELIFLFLQISLAIPLCL
jgi:hypothetical protein